MKRYYVPENETLIADTTLMDFCERLRKRNEKNPTEQSKEDYKNLLEVILTHRKTKVILDHTREELRLTNIAFWNCHHEKKKLEFQNNLFKNNTKEL